MKQKLLVVATLILLQASTSIPSIIGQQLNESQRSYQQARRVLDDAITAHGGLEAMRAVKDFTLKEKGKVYARFQSPGSEPPFSAGTSEETLIVDTDRGFVFDDLKTVNTGFNNRIKTVIKGKEGHTFDMWSKTATPIVNPTVNNFRGQMRRLPSFVLLEALDRASTLRWVVKMKSEANRRKLSAFSGPTINC